MRDINAEDWVMRRKMRMEGEMVSEGKKEKEEEEKEKGEKDKKEKKVKDEDGKRYKC